MKVLKVRHKTSLTVACRMFSSSITELSGALTSCVCMFARPDPLLVFWGVGGVHRVLLPSPTTPPVDPAYDFLAKLCLSWSLLLFRS